MRVEKAPFLVVSSFVSPSGSLPTVDSVKLIFTQTSLVNPKGNKTKNHEHDKEIGGWGVVG